MSYLRYLIIGGSALGLMACGGATAPVPDTLLREIQTAHPVNLQKIAEGVWVHSSAYRFPGAALVPSNGLVVEDGESLILIDTAWGELATLALLAKIETEIGKPVKKLIITHHHYDRLAGVDILEARGAEVFSHPKTANLSAGRGTPVPNTSVGALSEPKSRSKLGPVEIAYPGKGHAPDNIVVYVPAAAVLFAGGLVRGADQKTLGNTADASIEDWASSLAWVNAVYKDAKFVVPGHGKGGDGSLPRLTLKLLAATVNGAEASANEEDGAGDTPN
jgi:metallo-beta-lactamase class B VIM